MNNALRTTITFIFCALFLSVIFDVRGQEVLSEKEKKKLLEQAREYMRATDFVDAFKAYSELHKMDTANPTYNYELGIAIFEGSFDKTKSKKYFQTADRNGDREDMPELFYYLGRVYHLEHNFFFAMAAYNTYKEEGLPKGKAGKQRRKEVEAYLQQCEEGKDLIEKDNNLLDRVDKRSKNIAKYYVEGNKYVQLENMGDEINSKFSEYGPIVMGNNKTLLFTSRRTGSTGGELYSDGQYFEDIYISANKAGLWTDVNNVNNSPYFNGKLLNHEGHNATVSISPDETELFFYTQNHVDVIRFDGSEWQEPEEFSKEFDKPGSAVTSITISPSGNTLYATAVRPDGKGGRDLYYSEQNDDGSWGELINLGDTINTELDEDSPFLLDDTTLFFSSKGHSSIGGYDVFVSFLSPEGWTKPKSLEIPINSPFDEVNYMVAHDRSHAFYASNRSGGYGEFDLYMLTKGVDMDIDPDMLAKFEREESGDTTYLADNEGQTGGESASGAGAGGASASAGAGGDAATGTKGSNSGLVVGAAVAGGAGAAAVAGGAKVLVIDDIQLDENGKLTPESQKRVNTVSNTLMAETAFTASIIAGGAENDAEARKKALVAYNGLIAAGVEAERINVSYAGMAADEGTEMGSGKMVIAGGAGEGAPLAARSEGTVHFASNSKYVTEYSQGRIQEVVAFAKSNPKSTVYLSGHSDHVGNEQYNLELSKKRVESVAAYLTAQGVTNPIRMEYFGEAKPRFSMEEISSDPNKLILNRRVQIVIF